MGSVRGRMGAIGAIPRPSGPYGGRPGPMAPGDVFTGQGCKFCDFKNVSPQKKTVRSQKLFFQIVKLSEFILFASPSYPLDKFLSFITKS